MDKTEYLNLNKFEDNDIVIRKFLNDNFDKIANALKDIILGGGM